MVLNTVMIVVTVAVSYLYYRLQGLLYRPERSRE
jgi:hypothetical protein